MVNLAFGYSSFLKDGGSITTYIRCTITEKNAGQVYYINMEIMARNPHIFFGSRGGLNPLNLPPPWIRHCFVSKFCLFVYFLPYSKSSKHINAPGKAV